MAPLTNSNLNLPCDGDGVCMLCKQKPPSVETLSCRTCITPWHLPCLSAGAGAGGAPNTMADASHWECPDCSLPVNDSGPPQVPHRSDGSGELVAAVQAIESDGSLTEQEKAKKRQQLVGGSTKAPEAVRNNGVLNIFDGSLNCSFCMQLPERPVTVRVFKKFRRNDQRNRFKIRF